MTREWSKPTDTRDKIGQYGQPLMTARILWNVTTTEKIRIRQMARDGGMSMAELLRRMVLGTDASHE